jgi:hypothetical protein
LSDHRNATNPLLHRDGGFEVARAVKIDDALERERVFYVKVAGGREFVPRGEPESKVASGGVAQGNDASEIKMMLSGDSSEVIGGVADVLEAAGPAATLVAEAAVLDVPGGDAAGGEIGSDGAKEIECDRAIIEVTEFGEPAAAVHDDDDGMRATAGWDAEFAELQRTGAVGDSCGGRGREFEDVVDAALLGGEYDD